MIRTWKDIAALDDIWYLERTMNSKDGSWKQNLAKFNSGNLELQKYCQDHSIIFSTCCAHMYLDVFHVVLVKILQSMPLT